MGVWLGPTETSSRPIFEVRTITGQIPAVPTEYYLYAESSQNDDWEMAFLQTCKLYVGDIDKIDLFMVGCGESGKNATYDSVTTAYGGSGGDGGKIFNSLEVKDTKNGIKITPLNAYNIEVGIPNSKDTSAFQITTADYSSIASGGNGAAIIATSTMGANASVAPGSGVFAFNEEVSLISKLSGRRYGAAGGGGGVMIGQLTSVRIGGNGAATGGGKGATASSVIVDDNNAKPGQANTGAAGGGGCIWISTRQEFTFKDGANGGSGIVIIRNHRTTQS